MPTKEGSRMKRILVLVVAGALAAFALSGLGQAATPKLVGTTGPGYDIEVTKAGKDVKKLKHGTYKIVVRDKSSAHNFHLTGPGLNKKTSVTGKGTSTWHVTLKKGTYRFVCDPHKTIMKGSFKVV